MVRLGNSALLRTGRGLVPSTLLQETHNNPLRWILPVTRALCIGTAPRSFLFGGVGLGAAVTALETATGGPHSGYGPVPRLRGTQRHSRYRRRPGGGR